MRLLRISGISLILITLLSACRIGQGSTTVTVGTRGQLRFVATPSNAVSSAPIPGIQVELLDQDGIRLKDAGTRVRVSLAGGVATLSGSAAVAALNGVASFSGLSIAQAGSFRLMASAEGFSDATSAAFQISAGSAAKLAFVQIPLAASSNSPLPTVTVQAQDGAGNPAGSFAGNVTIEVATGPSGATLSGTRSVIASSGTAGFSALTLDKSGSYTLRATATGLASASSGAFYVGSATPTSIAFLQQPSPAGRGAGITPAISVVLRDAAGNISTGATGTVTLAIASGTAGAVLGGSATQSLQAGVATFSGLTINKAGTYTLSAAYGTLPTATSAAFSVAPGPATQLAFVQQPTNALTGVVLSPAVTVIGKDSDGVSATAFAGTVTLSIATGTVGAVLGGTSSTAASSGTATFGNLTLSKAGAYTLTATAAGLASAASASFTVTNPPSPTVSAVTPAGGFAGTLLKITGTNLAGATVTFAGMTAPTIPIASSGTEIQVVIPIEAVPGVASVTTAAGTVSTQSLGVKHPVIRAATNACQSNFTSYGDPQTFTPNTCPIRYSEAGVRDPAADAIVDRGHRYTQAALYYYQNSLGRNGYDDAGGQIPVFVHYGQNFANAYYYNVPIDHMAFGDGASWSNNFMHSADIVGHEFTHAVYDKALGGDYYFGESGAVNEAFADLHGVLSKAAETKLYGAAVDWASLDTWAIGKGILKSAPAAGLRNLKNPAEYFMITVSYRAPSRDSEAFSPTQPNDLTACQANPNNCVPCSEENDTCHVHRNSTVIGHFLYTVADAIGADKTGKLAYILVAGRYLTNLPTFAMVRTKAVEACNAYVGTIFTAADCSAIQGKAAANAL